MKGFLLLIHLVTILAQLAGPGGNVVRCTRDLDKGRIDFPQLERMIELPPFGKRCAQVGRSAHHHARRGDVAYKEIGEYFI